MKKYLAILLLLCCGCSPPPNRAPLYERGQMVQLRISGRRGQILKVQVNSEEVWYTVRFDSKDGPKKVWDIDEFELTLEKR